MNLLKNRFVQALGVMALIYLCFQALAWGLDSILKILTVFSHWYRFYAIKWMEEVAIAIGFIFLLISATVNSKNDF